MTSIATVRGLCTSSLSSTSNHDSTQSSYSYSSRISSSFIGNALPRRSHRNLFAKRRIITFAVLADPKVKTKQDSKGLISLEQSDTEENLRADARVVSLFAETASASLVSTSTASASASSSNGGQKSGGQAASMGLSDTAMESTLEHRLWVAAGGLAVTGMVTKALSVSHSPEALLQVAGGAFAAYILSDLGTGFYHWGVDNYGDAKTPVFGAQIDGFQGHHQRPWTITKREFANNIHAIARPASIFLAPFLVLPGQPFADSFLGIFLGCVVMSQQFHAWAHMKKSQLPGAVISLQDAGILVSRKMHGAHHKPPYDVNYCIVSGIWNPTLEKFKVFKRLERSIYSKLGVAPRAWSETSTEWLQNGTYFEDGTDFESSQSS